MSTAKPRPTVARSDLPRVDVPGDPAVCRMGVLTVVGTAVCLATAAGLLSTSEFRAAWWAWAMVAFLALPAIRSGPVTISLAIADDVLLWAILGAQPGWPASLIVFGLHTGVTGWLLAASIPAAGRWHRSALHQVARRWVWIQVAAQVASVLAAVTASITDPLIGAVGVVAGIAVVLALAFWGLRPRQERREP